MRTVAWMLFILFGMIRADTKQDSLIIKLADHGFENIQVEPDSTGQLSVFYENRIYRHELLALGVVMATAEKHVEYSLLRIIPLQHGIPIAEIKMDIQDYRNFIAGKINIRTFSAGIEFNNYQSTDDHKLCWKQVSRKSYPKLDVWLYPGTRMQMGNWEDRYKWGLSVQPRIQLSLLPGIMLYGEPVIPLVDEINEYTNEVRLGQGGLLVLRKMFTLYGCMNLGVFKPDRYGFSAELMRYFFDRTVRLSGQYDRTGFLLYQNGIWNYSDITKDTWQLRGDYFFPVYDLSINAGYAQFLHGDRGFTVGVNRIFSETEIGFSVTRTDLDTFGTIRFKIPLPGQKRFKPSHVRIQHPFYYRMNFTAVRQVTRIHRSEIPGVSVRSGFDLDDWDRNVRPTYLKNNLDILKSAASLTK